MLLAYLGEEFSGEVGKALGEEVDEEVVSRLAIEREADIEAGYVPEFAAAVRAVAPRLFLEPGLRLITDAGGLNPAAGARAIAPVLADAGSSELPLGVVRGDDLRESLEELYACGCPFEHRETGAPFTELQRPILAAHAELGAAGVRQALVEGARVVVAGVTAPSSLAVAAAVDAFGWAWDDWDKIAAAALAGALLARRVRLTCGPDRQDPLAAVDVAPPIAELGPEGQVALSKVPGADGQVTREEVAPWIAKMAAHAPRLLTPDVELDLSGAEIAERAERQDVLLWGAGGRPAAASYRATLYHHDGYRCLATLWIGNPDNRWTGERLAELVAERVRPSGHSLESLAATGLGSSDGNVADEPEPRLVQLRAGSRERAAIEQFADEVAALPRSVPCDIVLLGGPRPTIEPLVRRWPTLVPRGLVQPIVDVRPVRDWL